MSCERKRASGSSRVHRLAQLDSSAICVRLVVFSPRCFPEGPTPSPQSPYRRHMEVGRVGVPSRETRHTSHISQQRKRRSRRYNRKSKGCVVSSVSSTPGCHLTDILFLLLLRLSLSIGQNTRSRGYTTRSSGGTGLHTFETIEITRIRHDTAALDDTAQFRRPVQEIRASP